VGHNVWMCVVFSAELCRVFECCKQDAMCLNKMVLMTWMLFLSFVLYTYVLYLCCFVIDFLCSCWMLCEASPEQHLTLTSTLLLTTIYGSGLKLYSVNVSS